MKHLHYLHSLSDAPITKQNQFVWEPFGRVMKRNAMHPCYDVMWHNLNDAHDCLGSFTIHYRKHFFLCVCCSLWSGGSRAGLVIISYYLLRESSAELIETNLWVRLRPLTHHTPPSPRSRGTVNTPCQWKILSDLSGISTYAQLTPTLKLTSNNDMSNEVFELLAWQHCTEDFFAFMRRNNVRCNQNKCSSTFKSKNI